MSIPSHRIEGRGRNRKVTVTFYGEEMPEGFHAGGVEYRMVRRARPIAKAKSSGMVEYVCGICREPLDGMVPREREKLFCPWCGGGVE